VIDQRTPQSKVMAKPFYDFTSKNIKCVDGSQKDIRIVEKIDPECGCSYPICVSTKPEPIPVGPIQDYCAYLRLMN